MELSVRRKRGAVDPVTGLVFFGYDKSYPTGERWVTPEKSIELKRRAADLASERRKRPDAVEYMRRYNSLQSTKDRRNAKRSKGIGKGNGVRKDATTPDQKKAHSREWKKAKRKTDPVFRMKCKVRSLVSRALMYRGMYKPDSYEAIVGCMYSEFKDYIESRFLDGMTWDNHGKFGWHLDHIVPLASAKSNDDAIRLSHYTNIQPLWWLDNLRKSAKVR